MRTPLLNFVFTLCRPLTSPSYLHLHKHARKDMREVRRAFSKEDGDQ
jgi:hypothetical protein